MRIVNSNRFTLIAWILAILSYSLLVVPQRYIPIWGDDFLLLRASNTYQGYGSDTSIAPFQTGMTKYRPLFLVPFTVMNSLFGDQLNYYLLVNTGLTLFLGIAFGLLLREATQLARIAIPIGIISIASLRFLWFSREWIYGSMEIISLGASLLALVFFLRLSRNVHLNGREELWANLFLVVAILTHERAVAVGVAVSVFLAILNRRRVMEFTSLQILTPFLIVLSSFVFKIYILQVNPLQGSLTDYAESRSQSLLTNFSVTIPSGADKILGRSIYSDSGLVLLTFRSVLAILLAVVVFVFVKKLLTNLFTKGHTTNASETTGEYHLESASLLVLIVGALSFGTMIAEPLVQERFLALPQLMFWILIINSGSIFSRRKNKENVALVFAAVLVLIELSYLPVKKDYYPTQSRLTSAFIGLDSNLNGTEPWILNLQIDPQLQAELNWALGYPRPGFPGVFSTAKNPPVIPLPGGSKPDLKCVQAEFTENDLTVKISLC